VLLASSAAGAVGYLGYAFVRDAWSLLLIGTFVLGVAALTFSQLFAQVREALERTRLAAAEMPLYMNAFRMAHASAWTFGPALASFTLDAASFRGLFLATSLIYAALFALAFRFVRPSEHDDERPAQSAGARASRPAARAARRPSWLPQPTILPWFLALVAAFAAQAISMGNMSLYVLDELGGTEREVSIIFGLAPVFELPLMLHVGLLATRSGAERLMRIGLWQPSAMARLSVAVAQRRHGSRHQRHRHHVLSGQIATTARYRYRSLR
jgi:SET family sugar efflux transporter-like MFS transporter